MIDIAFHGPVDGLKPDHLKEKGALLDSPWTKDIFLDVDWANIYTFSDTLKKLDVQMGQVLNAVGCPYACKSTTVTLPPPFVLRERGIPDLEVRSEGCIFCDVSRDKGYHGRVETDRLMAQIAALPEVAGRKIPFELIDEYPIRSLGQMIEDCEKEWHQALPDQPGLPCRRHQCPRL